jgi:hypothetical protein
MDVTDDGENDDGVPVPLPLLLPLPIWDNGDDGADGVNDDDDMISSTI